MFHGKRILRFSTLAESRNVRSTFPDPRTADSESKNSSFFLQSVDESTFTPDLKSILGNACKMSFTFFGAFVHVFGFRFEFHRQVGAVLGCTYDKHFLFRIHAHAVDFDVLGVRIQLLDGSPYFFADDFEFYAVRAADLDFGARIIVRKLRYRILERFVYRRQIPRSLSDAMAPSSWP
jgi:hypothetical protein